MSGSWSRRDLFKLGGVAGAAVAGGAAGVVGGVAAARPAAAQAWHSELVRPGPNGLEYAEDGEGNRIPDFSWAGYRNGEVPLPDVPVVRTISPVGGDNTAHIQQALDEVGQLPLDADGFRGALYLEPGEYRVAGTIRLNRSGVVLRGAGRESTPTQNSIIIGTGSGNVETVIRVGGNAVDWAQVAGTRTDIVSDLVQVGSRTFTVADASNLNVGDNLIVYHPHTQAWLDAIDGGGVIDAEPWPVGTRPIIYNRYIKAIDGNDVTVCAPVFNHLNRSLSQSYAYVWTQANLIRNVGVESLMVHMDYPPAEDENHPQNGLVFDGVEDGWVWNASFLHFSFAGVRCLRTTRTTVLRVRSSHPRSELIGSRRYNFLAGAQAQQILFRDLWSTHARHAFVASGTSTTSGCAWVDGFNENGFTESGGHHRWSQGLLFDNIEELASQSPNAWVLSLHNRADIGSGHGWSSVHSVAWNCTVNNGKRVCVQKPPTAQNYAIGTTGAASGVNWRNGPTGYIEGTNSAGLEPACLYDAQLADRL